VPIGLGQWLEASHVSCCLLGLDLPLFPRWSRFSR